MVQIGGAAGHCPPVQKVTHYSPTSLVCLKCLRRLKLKDKHKTFESSRGKISLYNAASAIQVSNMVYSTTHRYVTCWHVMITAY